jgi:importin subunit beta-1
LLQNVTSGEASVNLKQSTLQTIGFICEEIPLDILETQANSILTAIIQGARKEEQRLFLLVLCLMF